MCPKKIKRPIQMKKKFILHFTKTYFSKNALRDLLAGKQGKLKKW